MSRIETALVLVLTGAAIWALLSVLYQAMVRPALLDVCAWRIFAARDALRLTAEAGQADPEGVTYKYLEARLNWRARATNWIAVGNLIEVTIKNPDVDMSEARRFEAEASDRLKLIDTWSTFWLIAAAIVNAPIYGAIIAVYFDIKRALKSIPMPTATLATRLFCFPKIKRHLLAVMNLTGARWTVEREFREHLHSA